jgi:RHS repeat-associated protein
VLHKAGTTTLDGAGYTYDNAGNRTAKTNYLNSVTENYIYDPLYQLTQVTQGTTTPESYSYDAVGNRLSSLGMSPYTYNSSNELTSTPAATFTYDGNGNTLTKADSSGTTTYNWDFENRLASVALPNSGGTVAFKYDPRGRRIQKSSSTATTNYLYDGDGSIEALDSTGVQVAQYVQEGNIDEALAQRQSGTTDFYAQDGNGTVTSIYDSTAVLANSYIYSSFGFLAASNIALINSFQFAGREYDSETGLYYYRARYYDQNDGRFLSEDPIRFDGGMNFYDYVGNSPISFTDPSGLSQSPNAGGITMMDVSNWFLGAGPNTYHSNDAATSSLSRSPATADILNQFKQKGCKNGLYCGEFKFSHIFTTINPVIQTVGSFCAYVTNLGNGEIQIDGFNEWGLKSLTANPWQDRRAPSLLDMLLGRASWGIPSSLLNNTKSGPMHKTRTWYHWTEKSPCCGK